MLDSLVASRAMLVEDGAGVNRTEGERRVLLNCVHKGHQEGMVGVESNSHSFKFLPPFDRLRSLLAC